MIKGEQDIKPRSVSPESPRPAHAPLPWRVQHAIETRMGGYVPTHHWHLFSNAPGADFDAGEASNEANAEFIVRAVNHFDILLNAAKNVMELFERYEEALDKCGVFIEDEDYSKATLREVIALASEAK